MTNYENERNTLVWMGMFLEENKSKSFDIIDSTFDDCDLDILEDMITEKYSLEKNGSVWTLSKKMKKLMVQYEYNGEKFEIWNTEAETLEDAWDECKNEVEIEEGARIFFDGEDGEMAINGGFR